MAKVDSVKRALELRESLKSNDKILVADFSNTLQGKDTSKVIDLMPNIHTDEKVFRAKVNIKELDIEASKIYDKDYFDVDKKSDEEIENFVKKQEFDFPIWFKHNEGFSMKTINDYNLPFILQVAGCNFHDGSSAGGCRYCFVDDKSNNGMFEGKGKGKTYLGVEDTIDSMLDARKKIKEHYKELGKDSDIKVLRVSGGEPTLALDWVLDVFRRITDRNLDIVGQIDSNLSTGYVVDEFEKQGIYEDHILEKLADFPIKVLAAIKGVSDENIQENVQSTATIDTQFYSIKRFIKAGFDIYPQMYNPDPNALEEYLSNMDKKIENFSLKIYIGPLKVYRPTETRLTLEANRKNIDSNDFIEEKRARWNNNYKNACSVINYYLQARYGVGYKDTVRSDVKLKLKE